MNRLGLTRGLVLRWASHACFVVAIVACSMFNLLLPAPEAEARSSPLAAFIVLYVFAIGGAGCGLFLRRRVSKAGVAPLRDSQASNVTRALYTSALVFVGWIAAASLMLLAEADASLAEATVWAVALPLGAFGVHLAWLATVDRFCVEQVLGFGASLVGLATVIASGTARLLPNRSAALLCGAGILILGLWLLLRRMTATLEQQA